MPADRKIIHVISNSHWDREWGYPFEETRLLLLDFMDGLLDLLENDPDFHSFTMDSQTLCVEDYLELRPEKRPLVEKHVCSGRLIVGPWYSLPEEYIVNGESLVRNLVKGHRIAQSYGKVSKVGYTPFSYGQTSQMPQIYNGFGIDTIIFYRGINTPHSEFILEGPDGSRVLGMRFGCMSRFSYYVYVYRVLRYGSEDVFARYDWDRGSAPFRLARDNRPRDHYYVLDNEKKQWNDKPIRDQLLKLVRDESEHFTTRHIACMQGFDTSDPDPRESDIIKLCQRLLPEHEIKLSSLEEYMKAMRKEVKNPTVLTGESRNPGSTGKWTHLNGDVISARIQLKQGNHRAETGIQRMAEPWSAIASMVGGEYLKTGIDRAWTFLLKNHPHDTITGAGTDQMEKDSMFRFDQAEIICDGLTRRAMQAVQINIDNSDLSPRDSVITVFNPCPFPRDGVVSCFIDMPDKMGYEAFSIATPDGKQKQRLQLSEESEPGILVRNLQDISIELRTRRVLAHLEIGEVPAYGYRTYHLVREPRFAYIPGTLAPETNVLENEHLRVEFNSNGTINLVHKETGRRFDNIHYIEDTGESGHTWIHMEPDRNSAITSHGCPVAIAVEEAGPLLARVRVEYRMQIPVSIEPEMTGEYREAVMNHVRRTDATKEITVISRFTLRAGSRRLDVTTELNNICKHHRMRVVFPTHLAAETTHSDSAFDVIERDIHVKPGTAYFGKPNPQYPMNRFVDISENKRGKKFGLAVLNRTGMREYEAMDTRDRPLAITLFRAFTYRNCPIFGRYEVYPEMEMAQCPGRMEWTYSLYPHTGDWTNGVYREAEDHNLPLEPAQVGPHAGKLPKQMGFLEVTGDQIQLTAFKRAEDRPDGFIVRLFNPTNKPVSAAIKLWKPAQKAWLTNLNEERLKEIKPTSKTISLKFTKKQILTVEFVI